MNRHVLLTMREHGLRRIIAGMLRTSGHTVVEAFDGPDMRSEMAHSDRAFDVILRDARRDPEAVLSDLARLRDDDCHSRAVLLVGHAPEGYAAEAERVGAMLLALPVKAADLRRALEAQTKKPAAPEGPPVRPEERFGYQVSMSPYSPARVR